MAARIPSDPAIYQRPVELLQNLIRFDTTNPPGNEGPCVRYIDKLLTEAGFETITLAKEPQRPNLIARLKGQGTAPPYYSTAMWMLSQQPISIGLIRHLRGGWWMAVSGAEVL